MGDLLPNLRVDPISFGLGFAAAILVVWLIRLLQPLLARINESFREQAVATHNDALSIAEIRFRNETIQHAQKMHLAADLFALDEILIPTRLLAPPIPPGSLSSTPLADITTTAIPYTPTWPEMASFYQAPTLDLLQALSGGANLVITGAAGCGKTVALAEIASRLCAKDGGVSQLENFAPLLVHAADLVIPPGEIENPLGIILDALAPHISQQTAASLEELVQIFLQQKRALLLLDGLDELPQRPFDELVQFLKALLDHVPGLQIVAVASPDYLGKIPCLGFVPVCLASWSNEQRNQFLARWGALWQLHFSDQPGTAKPKTEPALINSWLLQDTNFLNPMELVCKTWAAYSGDSLGPGVNHAIEATIRRMLYPHADQHRQALEWLAANIILNQQPTPNRKSVQRWLGEQDETILPAGQEETETEILPTGDKHPKQIPGSSAALADLVNCGILRAHRQERFRIRHPIFCAYLAAERLMEENAAQKIVTQPDWTGKFLSLGRLASMESPAKWLQPLVKSHEHDLLLSGLLQTARWLRDAPDKKSWSSAIMRRLAVELQNPQIPFALKSCLASALVLSAKSGVTVLMRQLLRAEDAQIRGLAALCSGMLADQKSTGDLVGLLQAAEPVVNSSAALGLAAIANQQALESLAEALLHGNEHARLAAAQSLANQLEEGHPALQEACEVDNPAVRRAAVFGLMRIRQPWVDEILEKLRSQDTDWMVQDAVAQTLEARRQADPRIPLALPELTQTPWLVGYAAQLGMGIAPGKPAEELLMRALKDGGHEQKLAALYTLGLRCDPTSLIPIYQVYYSGDQEIRQAALLTLQVLAASGLALPPPIQVGFA